MAEDQKRHAKEMHRNGVRHPSPSCLAGHDRCPRSMPLPRQRSAGRACGGSRGALKLQDGSGHAEAVAPNGCSGGHWAGYRQCHMGLGMGLHPTASPDVTLVLLAQPPREPGHGAGPTAHSAGVGDEGLPPPALPTLASRNATAHPGAAPSPSPPARAPSPGRGRLSLTTGINSPRCYIKCFNKSLIYHTSCLLPIDSFSNFTQKRQSSRTGQIYSV